MPALDECARIHSPWDEDGICCFNPESSETTISCDVLPEKFKICEVHSQMLPGVPGPPIPRERAYVFGLRRGGRLDSVWVGGQVGSPGGPRERQGEGQLAWAHGQRGERRILPLYEHGGLRKYGRHRHDLGLTGAQAFWGN